MLTDYEKACTETIAAVAYRLSQGDAQTAREILLRHYRVLHEQIKELGFASHYGEVIASLEAAQSKGD